MQKILGVFSCKVIWSISVYSLVLGLDGVGVCPQRLVCWKLTLCVTVLTTCGGGAYEKAMLWGTCVFILGRD